MISVAYIKTIRTVTNLYQLENIVNFRKKSTTLSLLKLKILCYIVNVLQTYAYEKDNNIINNKTKEDFSMRKIFRKVLSVVAAAAVCCGMMTPMTANAAVCTHNNMLLGAVETVVGGYTHYYMASSANGTSGTRVCSVTVKQCRTAYICSCGYYEILAGGDTWTEEVHSAASDPYHN